VRHLAERKVDLTATPLRMPLKTGGCRVVLDDVSSHEWLEALN